MPCLLRLFFLLLGPLCVSEESTTYDTISRLISVSARNWQLPNTSISMFALALHQQKKEKKRGGERGGSLFISRIHSRPLAYWLASACIPPFFGYFWRENELAVKEMVKEGQCWRKCVCAERRGHKKGMSGREETKKIRSCCQGRREGQRKVLVLLCTCAQYMLVAVAVKKKVWVHIDIVHLIYIHKNGWSKLITLRQTVERKMKVEESWELRSEWYQRRACDALKVRS
jgi:hypothetical protein